MANSLWPGFVKLKYISNGHIHYQVLPVQPDGPEAGVEPSFLLRNGVDNVLMSTAVDAYIALIDNFFPASTNFVLAEYWNIANVGDDPVFFYAYLIGAVGVNASPSVENEQIVITLRSNVGGILKLYYMEGSFSVNLVDDYPFSNVAVGALADYLVDPSTGWVCARDGGFPISPLRMTTKTNDVLRKKYLLS